MKIQEIRKLNDEKLEKLKQDLVFELMKSKSTGTVDEKKAKTKGAAKSGEKTSFQKEIKRTIAKVLTIIRERELDIK